MSSEKFLAKLFLLTIGLLLFTIPLFSQPRGKGIVAVSDGTTTVYPYRIDYTGATVSDGGDGTADVSITSAVWTDGGTEVYPTNGEDVEVRGTSPAVYLNPTAGDTWHIFAGAESYLCFSNYTDGRIILVFNNDGGAVFSGGIEGESLHINGQGSFDGNLSIAGISTFTGNSYFQSNVGIGTTSPSHQFTIQPPSAATTAFNIKNALGNDAMYTYEEADSDIYLNLKNKSGIATVMLDTEGNSYLTGGSVGIGTSSPGAKLEIDGGSIIVDGSDDIKYKYDGRGMLFDSADDSNVLFSGGNATNSGANVALFGGSHATLANVFRIRQSATSVFYINSSGNIGINTTGPDKKLDVLDATNPQLRLTHTDGTIYTDFQTDASGDLTITPSGDDTIIAGNTVRIPHGTTDATLSNAGNTYINETDDQICVHMGATGEAQGEVALSVLKHIAFALDPAAWYDQESTYRVIPLFFVGDDFIEGFTLTEWKVAYVGGDPTTEFTGSLCYDTTPDFNPAVENTDYFVMDVITTSAGASTADTGFDISLAPNGSQVYIFIQADPTDANVIIAVDIWGYAEED